MALTSTDLENLDTAIATGELEVEFNGRRVRYRSVPELMAARNHVASILNTSTVTPHRTAYQFDFTTSIGD